MLIIHHLGISQSERIVWLCEELNIPYQLVRYERDSNTRLAPDEYKALHPFGTAPVITDNDIVLAESGAIIDYIIANNGSLMPAISMMLVINLLNHESSNGDPIIQTLLLRVSRAFELAEKRLGTVNYFAGNEFTAADIMMLFPFTTMRAFVPFDLVPYPNIRAYWKRIGERTAYQQAMKKGDPDFKPILE